MARSTHIDYHGAFYHVMAQGNRPRTFFGMKTTGNSFRTRWRRLAGSREAVGIDCSGFISRCWNLPRAYSTRELPKLCRAVAWDDLQPGDILNTENAHVLLFAGWEGSDHSRLLAYETGCPPTWKIFCHTISVPWLKGLGYSPWRYRRMQP